MVDPDHLDFLEAAGAFFRQRGAHTTPLPPCIFYYVSNPWGGKIWWIDDAVSDSESVQTLVRILANVATKKNDMRLLFRFGQCGATQRNYDVEPLTGTLGYLGSQWTMTWFDPQACAQRARDVNPNRKVTVSRCVFRVPYARLQDIPATPRTGRN
jgi:hypothetical protein